MVPVLPSLKTARSEALSGRLEALAEAAAAPAHTRNGWGFVTALYRAAEEARTTGDARRRLSIARAAHDGAREASRTAGLLAAA